ncbi:MAG: family N-acetyltransferase [Hydrocarboniphaga sp.]|uniref:GNAT family N-acetyltransferase n=1 Tax=Hydrocarboniphaga sp. TaxID=2033016 RepID=UPI002606A5B0|nr:GNAT family N-acetyltransferase [Hydrocarboniphaga sp.]MDB5969410.1 family N-acetyltransferase [Hydrocarboniphaga sp.]
MKQHAYPVIAVTDDTGILIHEDWLLRSETVHRQLRPALPERYADCLQQVFEHGGRMAVAADGDRVVAVMVWRLIVNTAYRRALYVDDLVTDPASRSSGAGKALLDWCADKAVLMQCEWLTLDSGTQRTDAHRFYFRERMHVSSFHFVKRIGPA